MWLQRNFGFEVDINLQPTFSPLTYDTKTESFNLLTYTPLRLRLAPRKAKERLENVIFLKDKEFTAPDGYFYTVFASLKEALI